MRLVKRHLNTKNEALTCAIQYIYTMFSSGFAQFPLGINTFLTSEPSHCLLDWRECWDISINTNEQYSFSIFLLSTNACLSRSRSSVAVGSEAVDLNADLKPCLQMSQVTEDSEVSSPLLLEGFGSVYLLSNLQLFSGLWHSTDEAALFHHSPPPFLAENFWCLL